MSDMINQMRSAEPVNLWLLAGEVHGKYGGNHGPVQQDGVFFAEDANSLFDNIANNGVDIPYYLSVNSFEGNSMPALGFVEANYDVQLVQEYAWAATGKYTKEQISSMESEYLHAYNEAAGTNVVKMSRPQEYAIGSQIYGDIGVAYPLHEEAMAYAQAGKSVHFMYWDTNTPLDLIFFAPSCCGVGHGAELLYTFGAIKDLAKFGLVQNLEWEDQAADYMMKLYIDIAKNGETQQWPKFDAQSQKQMIMRNTDTEFVQEIASFELPIIAQNAVANWKSLPVFNPCSSHCWQWDAHSGLCSLKDWE